jgi:hypothetical protein
MTLNTRHLLIIDQKERRGNDLDGCCVSSGGIQESHFSKEKKRRSEIYDIFMNDLSSL